MNDDVSHIRQAQMSDITSLDRLFQRSYAQLLAMDYPPSVLVTAIPIIGRAQPDLIRSGLFFVAERGDAIIGAGGWSMQAPGGRPGVRGIGHIRHVATDPDHVRQGVAQLLMAAILMGAKACGMVQMQCQSTLSAVGFYEAMGFVACGDIDVPLPGGLAFPAVHMERML
ncbi:GNAT family N-acetyltransferase [Thalassococcus lentus]|uniref:GNAT family N-acetyltransferase n=1 Tax=Thalassococcus lentus TaxID=1210524 RepID=A0ABT4XXV0_9RHOB|nr:GNAT family N-acetyltransferase [Thalassococcus lentus]MDA7426774.1 GNAT family N-acetyltransferase [Thalassococcus lentus]